MLLLLGAFAFVPRSRCPVARGPPRSLARSTSPRSCRSLAGVQAAVLTPQVRRVTFPFERSIGSGPSAIFHISMWMDTFAAMTSYRDGVGAW